MVDVAASFGMQVAEITDDPWLIMHWVQELKGNLPAFINIHTVRHLWHAGTGQDSAPEWNRFLLVKEELERLSILKPAEDIELNIKDYLNQLWRIKREGS